MNHEAIRDYLEGAATKQQRLGHYDCVRFAIELLYVGFDRDFRGDLDYWDRRSAVRRLRKAGGLAAAFSQRFGAPVYGDELVPGDVAYYSNPATVGVVLPSCVAVFFNSSLHALERSTAVLGWRTF